MIYYYYKDWFLSHCTIYADKYNYYYCLSSNNNALFFKISVVRRFLYLIHSNAFLLNNFILKYFLTSFVSFFVNFYYSLIFPFKRRVKLHGLSFGADLSASDRTLTLNVGFAHMPTIIVPSAVSRMFLSLNHRKLLFESRLLELVSRFVVDVKNIRPVGLYFNPAKRGGRRGIRVYLSFIKRKKFKKDSR